MFAGILKGQDTLSTVRSDLQIKIKSLAASLPFDTQVTSGIRTDIQQLNLWAKGRPFNGPIVTYAKTAKESAHGRGAAVDLIPLVNGKAPADDSQLWQQMGAAGQKQGLTWGGNWKSQFPPYGDLVHFELADWKNLPMPFPWISVGLLGTAAGLAAFYFLYMQPRNLEVSDVVDRVRSSVAGSLHRSKSNKRNKRK